MNGLARRLSLLLLALSVCLCASGCTTFYPRLRYLPSVSLNETDPSVHVYECEAEMATFWSRNDYTATNVNIQQVSLEDGRTTPRSLAFYWEKSRHMLIGITTVDPVKKHFFVFYRPGYHSKLAQEWDFSFNPEWEATQCVEEDERAMDVVLLACPELPWEHRQMVGTDWTLDRPMKLDNEHLFQLLTIFTSATKRPMMPEHEDLLRLALDQYARLFHLAQRLPTKQVIIPYNPEEHLEAISPDEREAFLLTNTPQGRHEQAIERLQKKVEFLTAALNEYGDGVPEEIAQATMWDREGESPNTPY